MTDPLSITAGTAGFISLGIQVTRSLVDYYTAYRAQDSDICKTADRLEALLVTLESLQEALIRRKFLVDEADLRIRIEKSIKLCEDSIRELQEENEKFHKTPNAGVRAAIKTAARRLQYPFRQSTLQKLDEDIGEIRENLKFALSALQLNDSRGQHDDLETIKSLIGRLRADQISMSLRTWLGAPDTLDNHSQACAKRTAGTGDWFVQGAQFKQWLDRSNSFLWLQGFAGCGKSVLCSSAIQSAFLHCQRRPRKAIAFFYFTFNDNSKQSQSSLLRALLLQLTNQLDNGKASIDQLEREYPQGPPPTQVLMPHLKKMLGEFEDAYILIDALDESPRHSERSAVLDALDAMRQWSLRGLHLLVTSRNEPDVRESLDPNSHEEVLMKNDAIDRDIENHISVRLDQDRKLRKWSEYHERIKTELTRRAKGVFRWVECQFTSLSSCPRSEDHLERLLSSLPSSLDETYERMLRNIDRANVEDAKRILTMLCSALRPLFVSELIDGIAIELSGQARLNLKRRLRDADDIHQICPGLVDIDFNPYYLDNDEENESEDQNGSTTQECASIDEDDEESDDEDLDSEELDDEEENEAHDPPVDPEVPEPVLTAPIVRIAHYSIQEYLESERIQQQDAKEFYLSPPKAHTEIARLCIAYLLDDRVSRLPLDLSDYGPFMNRKELEYPFIVYAAFCWYRHYEMVVGPEAQLDRIALDFLWADPRVLFNWQYYSLLNLPDRDLESLSCPVYYLSFLGSHRLLQKLAEEKREERTKRHYPWPSFTEQINAKGGRWHYPILTAIDRGNVTTVRLLIKYGADVNVQTGKPGRMFMPVHCASSSGDGRMLRFLLDEGAEVNTQDSLGYSPLHWASFNTYGNMTARVKLLVDHGAEVNARTREGDGPLENICQFSHITASLAYVAHLLLKHGANVNHPEGYSRALERVSENGEAEFVNLLLKHGAVVNSQFDDGYYCRALEKALQGDWRAPRAWYRGSKRYEIVQLLLNHGAIINRQSPDGYYCPLLETALKIKSKKWRRTLFQLLLDHGAISQEEGRFITSSTGNSRVLEPKKDFTAAQPTVDMDSESSSSDDKPILGPKQDPAANQSIIAMDVESSIPEIRPILGPIAVDFSSLQPYPPRSQVLAIEQVVETSDDGRADLPRP